MWLHLKKIKLCADIGIPKEKGYFVYHLFPKNRTHEFRAFIYNFETFNTVQQILD